VSPELTRELVSLLPNARLAECADSGHTVAIEQPDWFAETVRAFLDG
jgi:pimeloyl-ACP methyl ester carboxylesterase